MESSTDRPLEIADAGQVKAEIVQYLGNVLEQAQAIALTVRDDESANRAADLGVAIKTKLLWLKGKRADVYEPLYQATERVRREYDDPIKLGAQLEKTLSAAVIKYKLDKKREEDRLRLAAEAEARRIREEAERKEREAEAERQRIIKEQAAREQKRRDDLAAEERRKQAEEAARQAAERAKLQKEQEERDQRIKEEEAARLSKAVEADAVGLGERVDGILEQPGAIAAVAKPLPTAAVLAEAAEKERLRQEAEAADDARRKAEREEEDRLRAAEAERMRVLQEDSERAKQAAAAAESEATAMAAVTRADERMRTSVSWQYAVDDRKAFLLLAKAVADGRAPVEYLGFDQDHPEKFKATELRKDVIKIKNDADPSRRQAEFLAIGVRTWPQESGGFRADEEAA